MNFLTTPVMYGVAAAAIGASVFAGVQTMRLSSEKAAHAETKTAHANVLRDIAEKARIAVIKLRARETEVRGLLDSSNTAREQGIAHAVEEQQRVVAGVRDESLRLRQQWRGCESASRVPGDAGSKPGADATDELRATDSGRLVRIGLDADLQISGLQDYARACQALTRP